VTLVPLAAGELHQHWSGWLAGLAEKIAAMLFQGRATVDDISFVEASLYAWVFVLPLLAILCWLGTSHMTRVPGRLQNVLELTVSGLSDFCKSIIGPEYADRFVNFIGGLFIYIFFMNLWGIVPGMQAATSTVNTTLALAACTFVMTHYAGFRYAGLGYLKHFAGEPLWLAPLMIPIHLIGELARPLSLTLRLFGNIGGEEKAVAIFVSLGLATGWYLPFQLPLSALGIFTSFVQALIFCLLSAVYISGALPHAHHGDGHGHEAHEKEHGHGHDLGGKEGLLAVP
jgi:F-type H+-transporting ATPase subunit a